MSSTLVDITLLSPMCFFYQQILSHRDLDLDRDLLILKSESIISVPKCIEAVSLVKIGPILPKM